MKMKVLAMTLLAAAPTIAKAQSGVSQTAPQQQPTTFMGVQMGTSLFKNSLPKCSRHSTETCWEVKIGNDLSVIYNVKNSPLKGHMFLDLAKGGEVVNVTADFPEDQTDNVATAMIEKYGEPTVKTPLGDFEWKFEGSPVSIMLFKSSRTPGMGLVAAKFVEKQDYSKAF